MDNSKTQEDKLKIRIPYNENIHKSKDNYNSIIESLLEDSKNIGLSLRFPFEDYSIQKLPVKYNNWQIRCCLELYKLAGNENIKKYAENGLNWEMFRNGLSMDLRNEITSIVGIPKESINVDVSNE